MFVLIAALAAATAADVPPKLATLPSPPSSSSCDGGLDPKMARYVQGAPASRDNPLFRLVGSTGMTFGAKALKAPAPLLVGCTKLLARQR